MAETPAVCEHIHFRSNRGSDAVLRRMRRSYRHDRYLAWLERIRDAIPDIAVTTDIIVGFPGETEDDFAGTLDVVERARFDSAHTFQYSRRRGTAAATFDDHVPKAVVQGAVKTRGRPGGHLGRKGGGLVGRRWRCWSRASIGGADRRSHARAPTGSGILSEPLSGAVRPRDDHRGGAAPLERIAVRRRHRRAS